MAQDTAIQWCDSTCNPSMGCDGCELWDRKRRSCYAGKLHETRGKANKGFAPSFDKVTAFPGRMTKAAGWSDLRGATRSHKPWLDGAARMIFVSDMGDSLSKDISFEFLAKEVIDVAESERGKRHVWQWLTKRPTRMAEFSGWLNERGRQWPTNPWVGTSITSASTQNRITSLLRVGDEATTRFLSVEPQIENVDFGEQLGLLDWIIQGGESGTDARPFDLGWARDLIARCGKAGVPYFLKQVGAVVLDHGSPVSMRDPHGGDWTEWPEELRVRELPNGKGSRKLLAQKLADFEQDLSESSEAMSTDAGVPGFGPSAEDEEAGSDTETSGVYVDPLDGRGLEDELNGLIARLADDMSELATVKLLPRAKELYERLHPETRHGGHRSQVAKSATWPSFAAYVAAHTGISKRAVYTRLETAEQLGALAPAAEAACFGCALSNQVGLLVRIARIPDGAAQQDIVTVYRSAGPKKAKEALQKREDEFGLAKPKPEARPAPPGEEQAEPANGETADGGTVARE